MKRLLALSLVFLLVYGCKKVPITGRTQLSLISSSEMNEMSFQQYDQVIGESKLSSNAQQAQMVQDVGVRIQAAVEKYMKDNGLEKRLDGYAWEFNLIDEPIVNAWCMPGGKVAFYTGILPVCQNEAGIAVVMGHEIAHAIAEHGNERMSQGMLQQFGGVALSVAMKDKPAATQSLFYQAYGVGSTVGYALPHSRKQESEADHLGLIFMAMAGYDPNEAPKFWQRMSAAGGGGAPEFLSTHPAHETRINDLNSWIPEAMKYYVPR